MSFSIEREFNKQEFCPRLDYNILKDQGSAFSTGVISHNTYDCHIDGHTWSMSLKLLLWCQWGKCGGRHRAWEARRWALVWPPTSCFSSELLGTSPDLSFLIYKISTLNQIWNLSPIWLDAPASLLARTQCQKELALSLPTADLSFNQKGSKEMDTCSDIR